MLLDLGKTCLEVDEKIFGPWIPEKSPAEISRRLGDLIRGKGIECLLIEHVKLIEESVDKKSTEKSGGHGRKYTL